MCRAEHLSGVKGDTRRYLIEWCSSCFIAISVGVWQGASVGGIFEARSLESSLMFNAYFQKKFNGKFLCEKLNR